MDRQDSLWDQLLPTQARVLSAELAAVNECLADGEVEHHAVLVLAYLSRASASIHVRN